MKLYKGMGQDYSPEELEQALDWAVKTVKHCGGCINQGCCYKSTLEEILDEYCISKKRIQQELMAEGKTNKDFLLHRPEIHEKENESIPLVKKERKPVKISG